MGTEIREAHEIDKNKHIDKEIGTCCNSRTYKRPTGCGSIYVIVVYKEDGKIDYFLIEGDESSYCGTSHLAVHADNLTFMVRRIRNKHEIEAIIKNFRFHSCNKCPINSHKVKSCSDAIGQILEEIFQYERP